MRFARFLLPLALAAPLTALAQAQDEGKAEDMVMLPAGYEAAMKAGDLIIATMMIRPEADKCEAENKAKGACFLLFLSAAVTDLQITMEAGDARNSMAGRSVQRAYDYLLPIVRDDPEMFGMISTMKGKLRLFERRYAEAETLFREAYGANIAIIPRDDKAIIGALGNMAVAIARQGREKDAVPLYRQSLALALVSGDAKLVEIVKPSLATSLSRSGSIAEAEKLYREVLTEAERIVPADSPTLARHLSNLASCLDQMSRYKEAEPLYRRALALRIAQGQPYRIRDAQNALADNLYDQRRFAEAEILSVEAYGLAIGNDLGDPQRTSAAEQLGQIWSYMPAHLAGARTLLAEAIKGRIIEAQDRPGFDAEAQFTMVGVKPVVARSIAVAWALARPR